MVERDRDATGRALNARPRDRFGRPLPPGSEGVPRIPDDLNLPPQQTLSFAQQLLNDGLAFNAHEVLEAAWKNGPFAERMLWQGLAQYAVGLTHIQRGNAKGAHTLLTRAINRLSSFGGDFESDSDYTERSGETADPIPYGIDAAGLIAYAQTLLADLDTGTPITEDRLKPRLCGTASPRR
ncbi:DUF309 domain-containing protein [Nocardia cyriacigeorgica]|uniref:DUF309 domain-containing protein n=1 Tax=Nocardia cyriacigeorgica TaxID=135487 RepID=UPI0013BC8EDB|nr:DUF309 domain-containing protein [Nocardia cyriacigeorgica]NEW52601.1 DUF309 domain-containing protein [Nocardia cyriacigeorgica]